MMSTKYPKFAVALVIVASCYSAEHANAFMSGDENHDQSDNVAIQPASPPSAPELSNPEAFDGRWMFTSGGCRYTGSIGAIIKHGRVIVRGGSGLVAPDGTIHTVGAGGGMTLTAEGHLESESGSGTFNRSDGCVGTWIAIKRH